MSMWLDVAAFEGSAFSRIKKFPEILEKVFFDEDEEVIADLGLGEADRAGLDYLSICYAIEAMAEATGDGDQEPEFSASGELGFSAGYDDAAYIEPEALADALANDTWSLAAEMDKEMGALLKAAVQHKKTLVFVVS